MPIIIPILPIMLLLLSHKIQATGLFLIPKKVHGMGKFPVLPMQT
jgi:hypothetical protein